MTEPILAPDQAELPAPALADAARDKEGLLASLAGAFVVLVLHRHPRGPRDTQVFPEYLCRLGEPAPEPL